MVPGMPQSCDMGTYFIRKMIATWRINEHIFNNEIQFFYQNYKRFKNLYRIKSLLSKSFVTCLLEFILFGLLSNFSHGYKLLMGE